MRRAAAGAALVLVLWLIVLLTALVGAFALDARVEAMQGSVLRGGAQADELARAGVEYALARLQVADPGARWRPDGRRYRWRFDDAQVDLRIRDEAGKVDLNTADVPLLTGLLQALGARDGQAQRLAGAIADWRDADDLDQPGGGAEDADYAEAGLPYGAKDAPFESIGELRRVLGMTPELYRKLLPEVTVFGNRGRPDPRYASAAVLQALGLDAAAQLARRDQDTTAAPVEAVVLGGTFGIESRVRLGNGREAVLRAVVRTGVAPQSGAAYTVLRWDQGREQ